MCTPCPTVALSQRSTQHLRPRPLHFRAFSVLLRLRKWVRRSERDTGQQPGVTTEDQQRMKALERENRELRRANEILRKASAYFAQAELDRRGS
jgi:hypothetical protein